MRRDYDILLKNNSGAKSKAGLIEGFVVRLGEYERLLSLARKALANNSPYNLIVIGPKGSGKTTLLHRLKYGIEDEGLSSSFLLVMFKEEQYNIVDTLTLWLRVIEYGEDWFDWPQLVREANVLRNTRKVNGRDILALITQQLKNDSKRLIIFVENINELFKKLGTEGQQQIDDLATEGLINFVGSSTAASDGYIDFHDEKFAYFDKLVLSGLNQQECEHLLMRIGREYGKEHEIETILKNHPGRVEALRRLTGGVPRIIVYLFQIFLDNAAGRAMRDLYKLVDDLTDLYKGELNRLSTQQLQVVDVLAKNWDAIAVKEIAGDTMIESKNISSILSALERFSVVERVKMEGKNKLYRIKDRFLNIWYLMRHGRRAERENVKWLVRFFDIWCDEDELVRRVNEYLNELKEGTLDAETAIDMGNTYLSCKKLPATVKYSLFDESQKVLPQRVARTLRLSAQDLYSQIDELIKLGKGDEAKLALERIGNKDPAYYPVKAYLHMELAEFEMAVESFKKFLEINPVDGKASLTLGLLYDDFLDDPITAEQYFDIALKAKHFYAAARLGDIAYYIHKDIEQAERYHRLAIKKKFKESYAQLWAIFDKEGEYEKALELSLEEVGKGMLGAYTRLGKAYRRLKMDSEAEAVFEIAMKSGELEAIDNLAFLQLGKPEPDLDSAEALFKKGVENKSPNGHFHLGSFYLYERKDMERAEEIWMKGVAAGDRQSAHRLGHYFDETGDYEKSDIYFLEAIRLGFTGAIFCIVAAIYRRRRSDKKGIALQLLRDHEAEVNKSTPQGIIWYAIILLWNNFQAEALEKFKSTYPKIKYILDDDDDDDEREEDLATIAQLMTDFMIHMLARREYAECLQLFEESYDGVDLKVILKPVYFMLMEEMKDKFPNEYLKAGTELQDTIIEIRQKTNALINELNYN
ncbi:hypothetical protein F0L74_23165 [Chitinophaga agrisoli]|uniref:Uncharacterized protein n=1 Tax=Chitinophaga agrisoli TaxID=2607653 RepID=A0A5B2VJU8_9BACT|nr:hypothetical protein [Chitinophaga agrisoli]KAA2239114.1 hypothetical protein F0L74_23165 [Chitinophaga agrisoli]